MERKIRVAVNGFGRIGRVFTRIAIQDAQDAIEIVAINDLGSVDALAHLLEFDSVQGRWKADIESKHTSIRIGTLEIPVFKERDPNLLPWKDLEVDVVLESTGQFKTRDEAQKHIHAGAKRAIISAVASGESIKTIVMGANEDLLDGSETIISNASCTTNCAAPLVDVIDRLCGVESGYITTVHSYTSDQSLHDRPHSDLRRARAAALSIIPTSTGAAKAITRIFPHLDGKLGGAGIRVPVPNGSLTDITYIVERAPSVAEVNQAFQGAAQSGPWKGILEYTEKPLVSSDIVSNPHSCVFDAQLTSVIGNMVKVVGWYDNEMGYSSRLIDLIRYWSTLWDSNQKV
jgi:glyceraldehyde 3-phosphate dehydrogenase